ncbi:MAG: hypothetical protein AB1798_22585 [Spirochaetota bacterium]
MNAFIKDVVISLGLLFGFIRPLSDPELLFRVSRSFENIYISVEVKNGINKDIEELINSGNIVGVKVSAGCGEGSVVSITHEIYYDPVLDEFFINYPETGKVHKTVNKAAAYSVFMSFFNIPVCRVTEFEDLAKKEITVRVEIILPEDTAFDAGVLWNYKKPEKTVVFNKISEIPF